MPEDFLPARCFLRSTWRHELRTGAVVQAPRLRLETHPVEVVGSTIMLGTVFMPRRGGA